ncbi:MAG: DEAD/DEAH box helicase [Deltaproteobacteria bacterium]
MIKLIKTVINTFMNKTISPGRRESHPSMEPRQITPKPHRAPAESKSAAKRNRTGKRKTPPQSGKQHRPSGQSTTAAAEPSAAASWNPSEFSVPQEQGKTRFQDFDLPEVLLHAIYDLGFQYCTPIQAEILPSTLAGKDASGRAQTGTGKTAAFLITVIDRLLKAPRQGKPSPGAPRVLALAPTRELVLQITEEARRLAKYCNLNIVSVFGGMNYDKQKKQLTGKAVDIVVATPGRLLDFKRRKDLNLKKVEVLIIDEADRMLDMGFIPDVRKIITSTPHKDSRQTLLFSATLTADVVRLASQWTRNPVTVEIEPEQIAVETVEQIVYIVTTGEKFSLLLNIITRQKLKRVLIFCNRRDEVRRLTARLKNFGINCAELTGDVPQHKRIQRLNAFKNEKIRALVAPDVAGRGIHIEGMDHVINYTLPRDPEDYVHRIGRTGRAGAAGTSISFADEEDSFYLAPIETFMGRELHCTQPPEEWLVKPAPKRSNRKRRYRPPKNVAQHSRRSQSRPRKRPNKG